ncbi:MAG: hypothetical protein ABWW70_00345 [Thermoproteota archaeon]
MRRKDTVELLARAAEAVRRFKVISAELLARELGVSVEVAELVIAALASRGVIAPFKPTSACTACPLSKSCGIKKSGCRAGLRVYVLRGSAQASSGGDRPA